jgi:hypothetical protein
MIADTKRGALGIILVNIFNFVDLFDVNFSSLDIYWFIIVSLTATLLCALFYIIPQKQKNCYKKPTQNINL